MAYQIPFEDPSVARARYKAEDTEAYEAQQVSEAVNKWKSANAGTWGKYLTDFGGPQANSIVESRVNNAIKQQKAQAVPYQLAEMFKSEADPYSAERDQVIRDPSGALNNSPFFKFMQEKYMNNATAKNAAGGFRNSGRGLMALGEAGQKASADYLFPYLQALGRPQSGANAFFEAYKFMNTPQGGGGGSMRSAAPRQSLSMVGAPAAPASALPTGGATSLQWLD